MLPYHYGVKKPGYMEGDKFVEVPEMIPDIIVPDLTDCELKPYVSYRVSAIEQPEWTPRDLFNAVYRSKIENDFNTGKLNADGSPVEPSAEERLTAEEARIKARQTGCDIYSPKTNTQLEERFDDYLK
ncbi:39S ribosomal protein L41, mitochondrial-like [Nilaparvata lugens]|nr:39S ribosomal protein L41, mitochondrial-like [Nilaparvata lugens]